MLLLSSNSPEFSPIENMFGCIKRELRDFEFQSKTKYKEKPLKLAVKVSQVIFIFQYVQVFFNKQNALQFIICFIFWDILTDSFEAVVEILSLNLI